MRVAVFCSTIMLFSAVPVASWDRPSWGFGEIAGDCRDTRAEILASRCRVTWDVKGCRVASAACQDIYSGERAERAASAWQIDHLYPASVAWKSRRWRDSDGAICRTAVGCSEFLGFFNDPENLQVTTATSNRRKSDLTPAAWCPSLPGARKLFARRYRTTAKKWRLTISLVDRAALRLWERGECAQGALVIGGAP